MQKPFTLEKLINTLEDNEAYKELQKLNVDIDIIKAITPTHEQVMDLLEKVRKIEKARTF
jgi:hypothetical protein